MVLGGGVLSVPFEEGAILEADSHGGLERSGEGVQIYDARGSEFQALVKLSIQRDLSMALVERL